MGLLSTGGWSSKFMKLPRHTTRALRIIGTSSISMAKISAGREAGGRQGGKEGERSWMPKIGISVSEVTATNGNAIRTASAHLTGKPNHTALFPRVGAGGNRIISRNTHAQ